MANFAGCCVIGIRLSKSYGEHFSVAALKSLKTVFYVLLVQLFLIVPFFIK